MFCIQIEREVAELKRLKALLGENEPQEKHKFVLKTPKVSNLIGFAKSLYGNI